MANVQGRVVDQAGNLIAGATVVAALGDDSTVTATTSTNSAGQYTLRNFPARTVLVTVTGPSGTNTTPGTTTSLAGTAFPDVVLYPFGVPVKTPNPDFSAGTSGWINRNGADVSLIDNVDNPGPQAPTAQPQPDSKARVPQASQAPSKMRQLAPSDPPQTSPKKDLRVGTSGQAPKTVSYTFTPPADSKTARVQYRFQTAEYPTYFGSRYNDSFHVALSSPSGQRVVSGAAMNELGRPAFDASGSTAWRELTMELGAAGEPAQLEVTVANVGDHRMESAAIVSAVSTSPLAITQAKLFDIDNTALQFLSAAAHDYFNGHTRVHAAFKVEGAPAAKLSAVELEVRQAGVVKARAPLAASLSPSLYKSFGTSGIQLASPQLAFELPAKELASISTATNGVLNLKLVARADDGGRAEKDLGNVRLLDHWTGTQRYGPRDENRGGDDWLLASTRDICNAVSVSWGDFSNMNAGSFAPDHKSHRLGIDADGWYEGYSARDADSAKKMLELLNSDGVSGKVKNVFVTHTPRNGNAFYDTYKNVTLNDGRQATLVIQNIPGHTSHFHWYMK